MRPLAPTTRIARSPASALGDHSAVAIDERATRRSHVSAAVGMVPSDTRTIALDVAALGTGAGVGDGGGARMQATIEMQPPQRVTGGERARSRAPGRAARIA